MKLLNLMGDRSNGPAVSIGVAVPDLDFVSMNAKAREAARQPFTAALKEFTESNPHFLDAKRLAEQMGAARKEQIKTQAGVDRLASALDGALRSCSPAGGIESELVQARAVNDGLLHKIVILERLHGEAWAKAKTAWNGLNLHARVRQEAEARYQAGTAKLVEAVGEVDLQEILVDQATAILLAEGNPCPALPSP